MLRSKSCSNWKAKSTIVLCCTLLATAFGSANAATIYDEAMEGDLSDFVEVSPWVTAGTPIGDLAIGANTVRGTFGLLTPRDSDVVTFRVPAGHRLESIDLIYDVLSSTGGTGSYMAIQGGTELGTGMPTVANNLSNALVSSGGDLLAIFAAGPFAGGTGLQTPLEAGEYTLGLHEIHSTIGYRLDFNVSSVPEPASAATLACGAMFVLGALRRRRQTSRSTGLRD